jgi:inhibitor of KinA
MIYIQPMPFYPYSIFPLGDTALIIDFGNRIDKDINENVLRLFYQLKDGSHPFIIDLIPAYSSLAVYYDVGAVHQKKAEDQTAFEAMVEVVEKLWNHEQEVSLQPKRLIKIPVCYAAPFATDIQCIAEQKSMAVEEIIHLHTCRTYKVYMIGFLPGFSYMGEVDERIAVPRKPQPQNVQAGAVGIAGTQTGIYPLDSPGGWQIIGRTPLRLFDKEREQPVLLQPGDEIQFYSITENEFTRYQARRS